MVRPCGAAKLAQLVRELRRVLVLVVSEVSKPVLETGIGTQVWGLGARVVAEVAEVIADEDARSLVLRKRSEISGDMVAVLVMDRVRAEAKPAVVAANVDPIATVLVRRLLVIVAVFLDTRHPSDVNQAVVATEAFPGEAKDDVTHTGRRANPGLADRERKKVVIDAWSGAVVVRELVEIQPRGHCR